MKATIKQNIQKIKALGVIVALIGFMHFQANAQPIARDDSFVFRNDVNANYHLTLLRNDILPPKCKIILLSKSGTTAVNYNLQLLDDSVTVILTDTVLSSYQGRFVYTVRDTLGNTDTAIVTFRKESITPDLAIGETNGDNLVNHFDIFKLGLNYNRSSYPRHKLDSFAATGLVRSANWPFAVGGRNSKFADIDGDGIVNDQDTTNLIVQLGKSTGNYQPRLSSINAQRGFEINLPSDTILIDTPNTVLQIPINFSTGLQKNYGLGYSARLTYSKPGSTGDSAYENFKLIANKQNLWKNTSKELSLTYSSAQNIRSKAYVRIDGRNEELDKEAGVVEIVVVEILIGLRNRSDVAQIKVNIEDIAVIDSADNLIAFKPASKTLYLRKNYGTAGVASAHDLRVRIYPNPFDQVLKIECNTSRKTRMKVMNLLGVTLLDAEMRSQSEIDTKAWPSGTYLLMMEDTGEVIRIQK